MRALAMVLGVVLVLIVGGIAIVMAVARSPASVPGTPAAALSPSPGATPSPVAPVATVIPSPATPQPEPTSVPTDSAGSPGPLPTDDPAPTSEPTPDTTANPTAEPAPTPAAPTREITFTGLGLDSSTSPEETTTPRYFTFTAQGPGVIHVRFSQATGRVRACLWRGDRQVVADEQCRTLRRGEVARPLASDAAELWTLSLIGADVALSPSVTLRLTFPTSDVGMHLEGFRFQGEAIENYNGFVAEVTAAADGSVGITALFDDGEGGSHPYRLVVQEVGGGPAQPYLAEGEGSGLNEQTAALAERSYRVLLENRQFVSDQLVLLTADLDWP